MPSSAGKPGLRPPATLRDFERWFARASSRPLLPGNKTQPRGVTGPSLRAEADARLRTLHGMSGLERLEVYNRQYWFRLITIMQEEYPCTLHVIGLDAFNGWVIRYLDAHPPASPYLADMDAGFPAFLRRRYREARGGADREKVLQAAEYDRGLACAFDAPEGKPPASAVPRARWTLAPHVTPLWQHWNFTAYRALCRGDADLTGRFPLRRTGKHGRGLCLHRHENTIYEKGISRAEFLLLDALRTPRTLDAVFRAAGKSATAAETRAMERNAGMWFQAWTSLGWITGELRVKS